MAMNAMDSSAAARRVLFAPTRAEPTLFSQWLRRLQPLLYLLPALIAVGIWVYRPLAQTFVLSFYEWNLLPTSPQTFVGLQNYSRIFQLPDMAQAMGNTLIYIVGLWPLAVVLPAMIAIMTDDLGKRAREIYRVLIFAPMIMAPVVVAAIWRWILHPTNGIVNNTLNGLINDFERIRFFTDGSIAIWVIVFITGWKLVGFSTLIFSSALTNINRDLYEASAIDGATRWQNIRFITIPLLSPTILFMTMLSILFASAWSFTYINVLTDGGPSGATTNIYYLLWVYGFRSFTIGWSSAAAMVIFVVFGIVAFLLIRLSNRLAFYDN
jgi:multiple sugar transport system permease protein